MTVRALLFDMDGTVIDSDPIHGRVFVDFLAGYGVAFSEEAFRTRHSGRQNVDIFAELLPGEDARALDRAKEEAFRAALVDPQPVAGLIALMDRAEAMGLRLAMVTNACRANVEAVNAGLGIAGRFETIAYGDELPKGKPDPAVYWLALETLGIGAQEALVFEDSRSGIAAAVAAGIPTIGMETTLDRAALLALGAADTIRDFTDPRLERWLPQPESPHA